MVLLTLHEDAFICVCSNFVLWRTPLSSSKWQHVYEHLATLPLKACGHTARKELKKIKIKNRITDVSLSEATGYY